MVGRASPAAGGRRALGIPRSRPSASPRGGPGFPSRSARDARAAADPPARRRRSHRGKQVGVEPAPGRRERRARGRRGRNPPRCGRRPPAAPGPRPGSGAAVPDQALSSRAARPNPGRPQRRPAGPPLGPAAHLESRERPRQRRRRSSGRRRRRPLQPAGARSAGGGGARRGVAAGGCARWAGAPERPASPPARSLSPAQPQTHTHQVPSTLRPHRPPPPCSRGSGNSAGAASLPAPSARRAQPRSIFPLRSQPLRFGRRRRQRDGGPRGEGVKIDGDYCSFEGYLSFLPPPLL